MPSATWPASLPQLVLVNGFEERFANQTIRTQMDVGPAKVRRRTTASPRSIAAYVELTKAQKLTLDEFYHDTLSGGSLRFSWVDPISQVPAEFRFMEPPIITSPGGLVFQAAMKLEKLP